MKGESRRRDSRWIGSTPGGAWAAAVLTLLAIFLYYRATWTRLDDFVGSLDHCRILFCDFLGVYHVQARAISSSELPVPGYYYSAFFAVLLGPLASLSTGAALWVWGTAEAAATILLFALPVRRLLRLSPGQTVAYLLLFVTSLPVLHNFKWGQVSVFVTAAVVGALWAYQGHRRVLAGVLLAVGVSLKYYPLIFLPYFVSRRDKRFLAAFGAAVLVFFAGVPSLVMGPRHFLNFQEHAISSVWRALWMVNDVNSQYMPHVVPRWLESCGVEASPALLDVLGWLALLIALAAILLVAALRYRKVEHDLPLASALLFGTIPFLIKTSWPHYFVFLPLCQAILVRESFLAFAGRAPRAFPLLLVGASCVLSSVFLFNAYPHWSEFSRHGLLFGADATMLGAAFAIALARIVRSSVVPPRRFSPPDRRSA